MHMGYQLDSVSALLGCNSRLSLAWLACEASRTARPNLGRISLARDHACRNAGLRIGALLGASVVRWLPSLAARVASWAACVLRRPAGPAPGLRRPAARAGAQQAPGAATARRAQQLAPPLAARPGRRRPLRS